MAGAGAGAETGDGLDPPAAAAAAAADELAGLGLGEVLKTFLNLSKPDKNFWEVSSTLLEKSSAACTSAPGRSQIASVDLLSSVDLELLEKIRCSKTSEEFG